MFNIKYTIPVAEELAGHANAIGKFNKIIIAASEIAARLKFKNLPGYEAATIINVTIPEECEIV